MDLGCCSDLKNLPSSSNTFSNESDPDCIYNLDHLESLDLSLCSLSSVVGRLCSLKKLSLTWGRILEIPDSLICFTVQQINLSGTMIESIPTSIKNASELLILILVDSVKLLSLPELPSQIEVLEVSGCTSLKSVASLRSALMQP